MRIWRKSTGQNFESLGECLAYYIFMPIAFFGFGIIMCLAAGVI